IAAALRATVPRTSTRPASISSTACSRERASPRRTSSASSRVRRAISWPSTLVDARKGLLQRALGRLVPGDLLGGRPLGLVGEPGEGGVDHRMPGRPGRLALRRRRVRVGHGWLPAGPVPVVLWATVFFATTLTGSLATVLFATALLGAAFVAGAALAGAAA